MPQLLANGNAEYQIDCLSASEMARKSVRLRTGFRASRRTRSSGETVHIAEMASTGGSLVEHRPLAATSNTSAVFLQEAIQRSAADSKRACGF